MRITTEDLSFEYIQEAHELPQMIQALSEFNCLAVDTETRALWELGAFASALDPHSARISLIQINTRNGDPWVVDALLLGEAVQPLIDFLMREDIIKVFHNSTFDRQMFRSSYGVWLPNCHCTLVMSKAIGVASGFKAAQTRGHSLRSLLRDYQGVYISKVEATSDWGVRPLRKEQLEYAALDVGSPSQIGGSLLLKTYELMYQAMITPFPDGWGMERVFDIDQKSNDILAEIEYSGMPVNTQLIEQMHKTASEQLTKRQIELASDFGYPVERTLDMSAGLPQVRYIPTESFTKLLNNPKALVEKVNERLRLGEGELDDLRSESLEEILEQLKKDSNEDSNTNVDIEFDISLVDRLLNYKRLLKMVGTNYLELVSPVTGCLHTRLNPLGASTSRMSSGGRGTFSAHQLSTVHLEVDIENPHYCETEYARHQ